MLRKEGRLSAPSVWSVLVVFAFTPELRRGQCVGPLVIVVRDRLLLAAVPVQLDVALDEVAILFR